MSIASRRVIALAAAMFAMAACGGGAQASPSGGGVQVSPSAGAPAATATLATPSAAALGSAVPATARPVQPIASIKVGNLANGMTAGPTGLWVVTDAGLVRIDPATNQVATSFALTASTDGYELAVTKDVLWLTVFDSDLVKRLDPVSGKTVATIASPPGPGPIATYNGEIWFGGHHAGNINRIDPKTNKIVATVPVNPSGNGGPDNIVPIQGSLWVGFGDYAKVVEIDPKSAKVTATVAVPDTNTMPFEAAPGRIWVSYAGDIQGIAVLDPSLNGAPHLIDVGGVPGGGIFAGGAVWVSVLLIPRTPRASSWPSTRRRTQSWTRSRLPMVRRTRSWRRSVPYGSSSASRARSFASRRRRSRSRPDRISTSLTPG